MPNLFIRNVSADTVSRIKTAAEQADRSQQWVLRRALEKAFPAPKGRPKQVVGVVVPATDFEVFWRRYPRKVAKGAAVKAWEALAPDGPLWQRIMAALDRQAVTWTDPKFIPHPATWLRQRRWEDEVPEPRRTTTDVSGPAAWAARGGR